MKTLLITLVPALMLSGCNSAFISSKPTEPLYYKMTDADVELADLAVQEALEHNLSSEITDWHNRLSGSSGSIKPVRTYKNIDGYYCRTYRETLKVGKQMEGYTETACRAHSGIWYPI